MRRTLKVLSALLSYPTAELQAAIPEMRAALDARSASAAAQPRSARSSLGGDRQRRSLRLAGALRAAVRPHALAVAATLRARARREPRPRPGDGGPQGPLRAPRTIHELERAARSSAAVPGVSLRDPGGRGPGSARRDIACAGGDPAAPEEAQVGLFVGVLLRPGAGASQAADRGGGGPAGRAGRGPQRSRRPRCCVGGGRGHVRSQPPLPRPSAARTISPPNCARRADPLLACRCRSPSAQSLRTASSNRA